MQIYYQAHYIIRICRQSHCYCSNMSYMTTAHCVLSLYAILYISTNMSVDWSMWYKAALNLWACPWANTAPPGHRKHQTAGNLIVAILYIYEIFGVLDMPQSDISTMSVWVRGFMVATQVSVIHKTHSLTGKTRSGGNVSTNGLIHSISWLNKHETPI